MHITVDYPFIRPVLGLLHWPLRSVLDISLQIYKAHNSLYICCTFEHSHVNFSGHSPSNCQFSVCRSLSEIRVTSDHLKPLGFNNQTFMRITGAVGRYILMNCPPDLHRNIPTPSMLVVVSTSVVIIVKTDYDCFNWYTSA